MREQEERLATLKKTSVQLGLKLSQENINKLIDHLDEVEKYGTTLGLTKANGAILLYKHCLDSLLVAPFVQTFFAGHTGQVLDVGSGAGFPGLPLAIVLPHLHFSLVERKQKRASFLTGTVALLKLNNVQVYANDITNINLQGNLVLFRALTSLNAKIIKKLLNYAPNLVAFKGRHSEAIAECSLLNKGGIKAQFIPLSAPFLQEERGISWIQA
jgi:16S rRNA (guanine527-N7)-methyltransferase